MILKSGDFSVMADEIREKKKVYIFGAGMIGTVVVPEIFRQYNLVNYIKCYIDNNPYIQGTNIEIDDRKFLIRSFEEVNRKLNHAVLIMAVSRFNAVLEQLEQFPETENTACYLFPMMCISNFKKPQIPKVIHYMWLGGKEIPDSLKKCIESWQKFCPDYKIKKWDERNYNIEKNIYMKNAYETGNYGFVPDYARLDILHEQGGIYMDTDIELIKPLDDLLCQDSFCGVEKWQTLNFGGCSGAVKGSKAIKCFLDAREPLTFLDENGNPDKNTCGYYDTRTALKYGYCINGKEQMIMNMTIYPYEYFHPYDYMSGEVAITPNTYSIHHFNGGWLDDSMREENKKVQERYLEIYELTNR